MLTELLDVHTGNSQVVDLTERITAFCGRVTRGRAAIEHDGLLHVFVPHATAGVALMETGSGSEADLVAALVRLLPRDDRYRHRHGSPGHGADHVLPALISPSSSVPVEAGRLLLGTWQSVVLVDLNADNPRRQVRLTFLGDRRGEHA